MHIILSLFLQTVKLSVMATIAAIIIWCIKLLFKNKLSSAWHYYIWFIVIIRLLLPYSLNSSFSIYNTVNIDKSMPKNIINSNSVQIISNPAATHTKVNINNVLNQDGWQSILHILSIIWVIIVGIGAVYLVAIYIIFCFKVKSDEHFREVEVCDTLRQCKKAMKVSCNIQIKKSKNVKTPCITGLIAPVILIPKYMVSKLTNEEIKYVIIHELVHFKRKDTLINWIVTALNLIHWFNPILYVLFKRLRQDSEISCDAKALSYIKRKDRKNYGNTIINLVSLVSSFDVKPWEASMVSKFEIKRRIVMISKFKKRTLIGTLVGVVAACAVCVGVLTNAKIQNINNNKVAKTKASANAPSKDVAANPNTDEKGNVAAAVNDSSSSNEKASNANKSKNTNKQNANTSTQNSSSVSQPASSNNKSAVNNSNEEDNYTPEEAAILAINHELESNSKITTVSKGTSGNGYANFSSGDIAATVMTPVTENGKKYYSVHLYSQSIKKNGGSGTIDNLTIAKDGSIYR